MNSGAMREERKNAKTSAQKSCAVTYLPVAIYGANRERTFYQTKPAVRLRYANAKARSDRDGL